MTGQIDQLPLRDIHLPDPISWWPPAPGWWFVVIVTTLLVALSFIVMRSWQRRRWRREARVALEQIKNSYQQDGNARQLAAELSVLLRRVAISRYPRTEVAALTGSAWLAFLDSGLNKVKATTTFSSGVGRLLIDAPYRPEVEIDAEGLLTLCQEWIQSLPARGRQP